MSFGVRVFDTVLDRKNIRDTSSRNSADFWKTFCLASNWRFSYERVHSLTDLSYFLNRKINESVIIFSGHGNIDGWHMTNGDVLNENNISGIHDGNTGKDIIFSSCLMAKNDELCKSLKTGLGAKRLFAYRKEMSDKDCFLNESILLTFIAKKLGQNQNFTEGDFLTFRKNTNFMKTLSEHNARVHPMEMYY